MVHKEYEIQGTERRGQYLRVEDGRDVIRNVLAEVREVLRRRAPTFNFVRQNTNIYIYLQIHYYII